MMKPSVVLGLLMLVSNASSLVGKSSDAVHPAMYTLSFSSRAMAQGLSFDLPPMYVECLILVRFRSSLLTTISSPPVKV